MDTEAAGQAAGGWRVGAAVVLYMCSSYGSSQAVQRWEQSSQLKLPHHQRCSHWYGCER
jgi:hypothetical protein